MKSLLTYLNDICQKNFFNEKILIVDSYHTGEQIQLQFTKKGYSAINLKIKTVRDLAYEKVEAYIDEKITVITDLVGTQIVYSIFQKLKAEKSLLYFQNLEATPTLSRSLYQMIKQLRLAGYRSNLLPKSFFLSNEKAHDIIQLHEQYEKILQQYQNYDEADLIHKAMEFPKNEHESIYILQHDISLHYLEKQFLETLCNKHYFKLPMAPIYGLIPEKEDSLANQATGKATPFSYLFNLEKNIGAPNLSMFVAKNEEFELREILSMIKQNKVPFDESVIFYTQDDNYLTSMYHLTEKLQIPVTYGDGIPIQFTNPGKLLNRLVDWIQNSYKVEDFLAFLHEGLLKLEDQAPSKSRISYILRKSQIGWGRNRYLECLQKDIEQINEKLLANSEADQIERYENQLREYKWLYQWFLKLFKKIPIITDNGLIDYQGLLRSLEFLISNHSKVNSVMDHQAKKLIQEKIAEIIPYINEPFTKYDAFLNIGELLSQLRVCKSGPKPGALHIASYKQGLYINRLYTFVVGLDNQRFPGGSSEDPILLDVERINFSERIELKGNESQDNLYKMVKLLASLEGSVVVSYSDFDLNENRKKSPSHLFLQCFRIMSGQHQADYQQLENELPATVFPKLLEEKDWWIEKLTNDGMKEVDEEILKFYHHIKQGLFAESQREFPEFTVYDGKIESDTSELDPRVNQELTITAGKLEKLATCPYHYFLEEVLGITPIDEITYDPTKWLDPATRGSLLHEIFEKFYIELKERDEKPCVQSHEDLLINIAVGLINATKEQLPPPNDRIFEQEKEEILESCYVFLRAEEEYCQNTQPLHLEYAFGIGDLPAATLRIPSGEIRLSGKIDRIDQINDDKLHIIDYKTGSTYNYDENKAFQGGRQLQHLLYALAIENHLNLDEGTVERCSYLFPTVKGLGMRYERYQSPEMRANGIDIIEKLLDMLKMGHFPMSDDPKDCKYCKMKQISRRHLYSQNIIEEKLKDASSEGLKRFKGVRAYD